MSRKTERYNMMQNDLAGSSAVPLYRQLAERLEEDIKSGRYLPGSRIPTEFELAESCGVSRVTVRKALAELSSRGLITRRSGKGSFVAEKKLQRGLSSGVIGFTDICRMTGVKPGAKTLKIALEDPSPAEAELLGLAPGEKMLVLERLRTADGKPVVLETDRYPENFSFLFGEDLGDASLYAVLKEKHGIVPHHSSKTIDLVFAGQREAKELGVAKGYPLLRIEGVAHDEAETVTILSTQLCLGDKFKLIV